jgi:hypothetical protein
LSFASQTRAYSTILGMGHFVIMIHSIYAINLGAIFACTHAVFACFALRHLTVWYFARQEVIVCVLENTNRKRWGSVVVSDD